MTHSAPQRAAILLLLGLWGLSAVLLLSGCRGGAGKANLNDLFISSYRYNMDEDRGVVRVYGRLDNTGQGRFREAEVHAVLRSASGDKRGENSVVLQSIRPGEKRNFTLTVTSHDRAKEVVLEVRKPEQP